MKKFWTMRFVPGIKKNKDNSDNVIGKALHLTSTLNRYIIVYSWNEILYPQLKFP